MYALSNENLPLIGADVDVPRYPRAGMTAGIVHFGVGGFHRAHHAAFIDQLLSEGGSRQWAICGVGVLSSDRRMAEVMSAQDGLYTLVEKHPDGHMEARVIGSIIDYLYAPDDPEAVLEKLSDLSTKIVSLTITEGGYNIDHVTGAFDLENPDIVSDLGAGAVPATVFGLITEALRRRKAKNVAPFTVLSCDNIQANGDVARQSFSAFAEAKHAGFGKWIRQNVSFPNCMVDRITPVATDEDRAIVRDRFGIDDLWPVVCEPFTQWVLEDSFPSGRPAYERVGVQMVDDVEPYELMKLRLLNASHQALCYFGYLSGYRYAHEAAGDPLFARFLLAYMEQEATPTLRSVPGIDLEAYRHNLVERFANPGIRDTLARLCAESSDRIPKWLLPVVRENLAAGGEIRLSAAIVASWARYAEGIDEQGSLIQVVDRLADQLTAIARTYPEHPDGFLANRAVFGDLIDDERFVMEYRSALSSLHTKGARATLEQLMG
jgi:mannitol 2-dehydrogenase